MEEETILNDPDKENEIMDKKEFISEIASIITVGATEESFKKYVGDLYDIITSGNVVNVNNNELPANKHEIIKLSREYVDYVDEHEMGRGPSPNINNELDWQHLKQKDFISVMKFLQAKGY